MGRGVGIVADRARNRQIVLRHRPRGMPDADDFELVETPTPEPGDGEVLCRTVYLSLDPYMRGRMNAGRSYATPAELGTMMGGGTVGKVIESRSPDLRQGALVVGSG